MSNPFIELGLDRDVAELLARQGITEPTPIQVATMTDLLAGRDVLAAAPTGSGKTIAFGAPLVQRLGKGAPNRPAALILTPTRELAAQIHGVLAPLCRLRDRWSATVYGGVKQSSQVNNLRRGVDVLVACPGRLEDLIEQGHVRLDRVAIVVIDEADRMSDMGFLPCVRRIVDQTRADRQTVLFSATLDGAADDLARTHLREPIRHSVAPKEEDAGKATHLFWTADTAQRSDLSAQIVRRAGRTVLFTRTKHGADRLTDKLNALGVRAAVIHGGRSQQQRDRSLADFHRGHVAALVATDVAARGIHVEKVACVVHFDLPDSPTDYQHRSGRTARAGERGMVVSLVTPDQRRHARNVQRHFGFPAGHSKPDVERIEVGAVAPVVEVEHRADDRSFGERPRTGGGGGVRRALGRDTGPRRFDTRRDATGTRRFANDRDAAEPRRFDDGRPAARPAPIDRAPGERRSRYSRVRTEATPRATESPWRDDRSAPGRAPTDQPARAARPYDGGPRDGRSTRPPKPAGPHRPGRPAAAPRRSGRPAR